MHGWMDEWMATDADGRVDLATGFARLTRKRMWAAGDRTLLCRCRRLTPVLERVLDW
jgi:hypothetical protein